MPICSFTTISESAAYLLWRIDESEELLANISTTDMLTQPAYRKLTHPRRRKEWLAGRIALHQLLNKWGQPYTRLQKDEWGRPYLVNSPVHLSISHSGSLVVVAADTQAPIGIDIQLLSKKLQNVQGKFLNDMEVQDGGNDIETLGIYWAAKEAIYKAYGGKRLSLKQDIHIQQFTKKDSGIVWGHVGAKQFLVHYSFYERHIIAWSQEA